MSSTDPKSGAIDPEAEGAPFGDDALGVASEAGPEARIAELEAELSEMNDKMLRAMAEAQNTRKRSQRDREEANKYGGVRLARDLLPVYDNLKRALETVDEETRAAASDFFEGLELTQRELLNAFAKNNITPISPENGERFDADKHQAMFEAPVAGVPNGGIIEVMQDGFTLHDRLLRAAMVGVCRGGGGGPAQG